MVHRFQGGGSWRRVETDQEGRFGRTPPNRFTGRLTMPTLIRLIIADDHEVFRQGLKSLFATYDGFQVVAEIDRASELEPTLSRTPCEVLVLDLQMDHWVMNEIDWLASRTTVVVLTASESAEDASAAIKLGARAVVQKRFALETLVAAIQAALHGFIWMPENSRTDISAQNLPRNVLTRHELEIIEYVASGLRNAEVAQHLSTTEGTVKIQLNRIFHKLGVRDRVELAQFAFRNGLTKFRPRS